MHPIPLPESHADAPVRVAFSGGLDSTVLLHLLAGDPERRAHGLRAIHIHHGLQADADDWARRCQQACDALGVPLEVIRVQVKRDGNGPEAAARQARYQAIERALDEGEVLATGHHRDDQAETFLLRALRASGPDGLAAMRPWRRFARGWHWRPLLGTPPGELLAHARQQQLQWVEDASNQSTDFDRNFLRHEVLPLLQTRWPHALAAFARSAALNAEAVELLALEDQRALQQATLDTPRELSLPALLALPAARRARVLRRWIEQAGLPPLPANGIERIETELLPARDDAEARFDWHGASLRRWREVLRADVFPAPFPPRWRQEWDGRLPLVLPDGGWLELQDVEAFPNVLLAHARQGGERIQLPNRGHSSELKKLLQERGIPVWTREVLPLLSTADGELLAAGNLIVSERLHEWLQRHHASLHWQPGRG